MRLHQACNHNGYAGCLSERGTWHPTAQLVDGIMSVRAPVRQIKAVVRCAISAAGCKVHCLQQHVEPLTRTNLQSSAGKHEPLSGCTRKLAPNAERACAFASEALPFKFFK